MSLELFVLEALYFCLSNNILGRICAAMHTHTPHLGLVVHTPHSCCILLVSCTDIHFYAVYIHSKKPPFLPFVCSFRLFLLPIQLNSDASSPACCADAPNKEQLPLRFWKRLSCRCLYTRTRKPSGINPHSYASSTLIATSSSSCWLNRARVCALRRQ